jgi:hypothetical protein
VLVTVISKYEQNLQKKHLGWAGWVCAEAGVTSDQRNERTLERKSDENNAVIRANGVVSCLRNIFKGEAIFPRMRWKNIILSRFWTVLFQLVAGATSLGK